MLMKFVAGVSQAQVDKSRTTDKVIESSALDGRSWRRGLRDCRKSAQIDFRAAHEGQKEVWIGIMAIFSPEFKCVMPSHERSIILSLVIRDVATLRKNGPKSKAIENAIDQGNICWAGADGA